MKASTFLRLLLVAVYIGTTKQHNSYQEKNQDTEGLIQVALEQFLDKLTVSIVSITIGRSNEKDISRN